MLNETIAIYAITDDLLKVPGASAQFVVGDRINLHVQGTRRFITRNLGY
ncbi:hypothetical protein [Nostoc sp. JL33]|nr:hypothetical protein [Nostoc sp. JL33]MBN3874439.1 hypothetical protein [Nostoc sp. JL33]